MSLNPFFSDEIIQESKESQLKLEKCEKFASDDRNFENVEDFATRLVLWNSLQINPLPIYLEEPEHSVGTRTEDLDIEVISEFDFEQAKLKQKVTEYEDLKFLIQKSSEIEIELEIIENETKKQKQKGSVINDGKQFCGIDLILNSQLKGLKYKNRYSKVMHPDNLKLFENPVEDSEDAFKHLCDGCSEVFETKGLYPLSTWCPHCSKGNL